MAGKTEMAEEKAKAFIEKSSVEDSTAYSANYGAHRVGITMKESAEYYSQWAEKGTYEIDLGLDRYQGPVIAATHLADYYGDDKYQKRILDVAAGTGFVGVQLKARGFTSIDALEPSPGMLEQAKQKNVYTKFYCEFLDDNPLPIEDNTYDCCVISGGMGEGHIPCEGLHELIRITKSAQKAVEIPDACGHVSTGIRNFQRQLKEVMYSEYINGNGGIVQDGNLNGGLVCIVMREEYLEHVKEYKGRLEPLMKSLEEDGTWKRIGRDIVAKYSFDNDGVVYKFLIC